MVCVKLARLLQMKKFVEINDTKQNAKEIKIEEKLSAIHMEKKIDESKILKKSTKVHPNLNDAQNIENILPNSVTNEQIDKQEEEQELKCKFAAIVMDRLFFYLTLIYAIITFVVLIMSVPNFYK